LSDLPKEIQCLISEKVIYAYGIDHFLINPYKTLGVVHRSLNTPITLELSKAILKTCGFDIENAKFSSEVRNRVGVLFNANPNSNPAIQMFQRFALSSESLQLDTPRPEPLPEDYEMLAYLVLRMVFRSAELLVHCFPEWSTRRPFYDIWHHHSAYAIEEVLKYVIDISVVRNRMTINVTNTTTKIIEKALWNHVDERFDVASIAAALILWNSKIMGLKRKHGFSNDLDLDPRDHLYFQEVSQTLFKHVFAMCVEHLMEGSQETGEGLPKFGPDEMKRSFEYLMSGVFLEQDMNPFSLASELDVDEFVQQLRVILPELEYLKEDSESDSYSKKFHNKVNSMLQEKDGYKKYSARLENFMKSILVDFGTVFMGPSGAGVSSAAPASYISALMFMSTILERQEIDELGIDKVMGLKWNEVENSIAIKVFDFLVEQELGRGETGVLSEEFRVWTLTSGCADLRTYKEWCSAIAVHWMKPDHRRRFQATFPKPEDSTPLPLEQVRRFDSEDVGIALKDGMELTMQDLQNKFLKKQASQSTS
jgi:hypothetical protein